MGRLRVLLMVLVVAGLSSGCTLYGWGDNSSGELGDGTRLTRDAPVPAAVNPGWTAIDAGPQHTCAIDASGRLSCWGSGAHGQLGIGDFPFVRATPRLVGTATDWRSVSAGGFVGSLPDWADAPFGSTCGIRAPGNLYCWGLGPIGSSTDFATEPLRVGSATDWTTVSVGGFHACGIRAGALYCWGQNEHGQLGDGTTTGHDDPVRIGTAVDWSAVSASPTAHTCGIRAGALYCWGSNETGQLGDGTTTDRSLPTRVGAQVDWKSVTTGGFGNVREEPNLLPGHTCGIRGEGELFCWGENRLGELGIGGTQPTTVPTREATASSWLAVSAGGLHTCGIQVGNELFCWGLQLLDNPGIDPDPDPTIPQRWVSGGWVSVSSGGRYSIGLRATDDSV